jgi:hypothetical protein
MVHAGKDCCDRVENAISRHRHSQCPRWNFAIAVVGIFANAVVGIFNSAVVGILPLPSLEFLPVPSLEAVIGILPLVIGIFASAVVGILPSLSSEFLPVPLLEFCRRCHWNFAIAIVGIFASAIVGILLSPSLEFCHRRRWNFAVAVVGIFACAVIGILPSPLLELCFTSHFTSSSGFTSPLLSRFPFCRHISPRFVVKFRHCLLSLRFAVCQIVALNYAFERHHSFRNPELKKNYAVVELLI